MSAKLNLSIGIGTLAVMLIMSFGNLYFTNQAKEQSEHNDNDIYRIEQKIDNFINMWEDRIRISNTINNETQIKIEQGVKDVLNNLTSHRLVTNISSERIEQILNNSEVLTGPEYERLADQRVRDIVGNVTQLLQNKTP